MKAISVDVVDFFVLHNTVLEKAALAKDKKEKISNVIICFCIQFEKEALEEEIDPKLIVGSYKLSNGSKLSVIAEVDEGPDQFRYTCLFSERHTIHFIC